MSKPRWSALLLALTALLGAAARAQAPTGLRQCAAIENSQARLACYDALAGRPADTAANRVAPVAGAAAPPAPAAPAVPPQSMAAPPPAATAPAAASIVTAPAPMAAPAPPAAAVDPEAAARNFGLSSAQLHSAPAAPPSIQAHVAQVTVDRGLRSFVVLDNGQTWLSTDGGLELLNGEQVTIKRAALGSFMLISATSKHSYHVRRVS